MEELITKALIESHLMSFIEVHQNKVTQGDGTYAWHLTAMVGGPVNRLLEPGEGQFKFKTAVTAKADALNWIRKNRPDLEKAAVKEAAESIRYRTWKRNQ